MVDDEPNIRKTLTISLEAEGHQVTAVSNFQDALAEAGRRFFDVARGRLKFVGVCAPFRLHNYGMRPVTLAFCNPASGLPLHSANPGYKPESDFYP